MDPFSELFTKFTAGFASLTQARKVSILLAAFITMASMAFLVYLTGQIEYRVLFSNLSSEDAGSIVNKLQEKKVPYKLSATGDAVSVPTDKVAELRLEMATAGLPQGGGVGFEIFDAKSLGATEFEQQLNYRRALQGELARTISSFEEIQQSRVHLALPRESLFLEQQKKATASVTIRLKQGKTLRSSQVEGIVHLVASSVEGISPEDVIVVDRLIDQENLLSFLLAFVVRSLGLRFLLDDSTDGLARRGHHEIADSRAVVDGETDLRLGHVQVPHLVNLPPGAKDESVFPYVRSEGHFRRLDIFAYYFGVVVIITTNRCFFIEEND